MEWPNQHPIAIQAYWGYRGCQSFSPSRSGGATMAQPPRHTILNVVILGTISSCKYSDITPVASVRWLALYTENCRLPYQNGQVQIRRKRFFNGWWTVPLERDFRDIVLYFLLKSVRAEAFPTDLHSTGLLQMLRWSIGNFAYIAYINVYPLANHCKFPKSWMLPSNYQFVSFALFIAACYVIVAIPIALTM